MLRLQTIPPVALVALAAAGCDIPTEPPIVEQRWVLPVESTAITVAELLPDGVRESGDVFLVDVAPASAAVTLGDVCPPCRTARGLVVPKPAFTATISVGQSLPADVERAELAGATVELRVRNGFSFDPIRPGGGTGSMSLTVRDGAGGSVLGSVAVSGATTALPPGRTLVRNVVLSGPVGSGLRADVVIQSPSGDPVRIDPDDEVVVTASTDGLRISSATVDVAGRSFSIDPVELAVDDLDSAVTDRIESGSLVVDVGNPFGLAATGQVTISWPGGTLTRAITLPAAATSEVRVSFTGDELRSFLGQPGVVLAGRVTADPAGAPVTVAPGRSLTLDASVDVVLVVGG